MQLQKHTQVKTECLYVTTLHLFRLNLLFLSRHSTVLVLCAGLGTIDTGSGFGKHRGLT